MTLRPWSFHRPGDVPEPADRCLALEINRAPDALGIGCD